MANKAEHKGIYIDPLTDFGFKRLFGDQALMIDFLTSVLNLKDGITSLRYGNTVRTGISKDDRSAIFDLYCTTGNDEQIIVEMQAISKLARLPAVMRKGIFTRLFELAKIAKMTKRQQNAYYKSLHDMNIIRHTINDLQSTIATLQNNNAALQSNNASQAQELEEYRRRYGSLNGSSAKSGVKKSK